MKMILVPDWVEAHLKLHGKSLGTLSNVKSLSTLSNRDLAFYSFLSERFFDLLPEAIRSDWSVVTDFNRDDTDISIFYEAKREFAEAYSYEFSAAKLVELCSVDCLGMASESSEIKRDCVLGFDLIEHTEDTFFVKAKEVDHVGLMSCYDQLFTVLDRKFSIETIAKKSSFTDYLVKLSNLVKQGTIVES